MPRVLALAASFLIAVGAGAPGLAQSGSGGGNKALEVPGGDIFGFSDPTDTGDKGDSGLSLELTGRAGKQRGAYFTPTGHALFAGPTLAFKLSDTATFNVVWTPQVLGRASGGNGPLDLANFERHQFGLKFAMSL